MSSSRSEESADDDGPTLYERVVGAIVRAQFVIYTSLVVVLLILSFLWPRIFISIPPGSRGVMFRYFGGGTVTDRVWPEGIHVIPPWDTLTVYEIRLQHKQLAMDVLSKEGLELGVKVTVRYRPNVKLLGYLHQDLGPEYFERLIQPEVEAHLRRTFGSRATQDLFSSSRDVLQELSRVSLLGRENDSDTAPDEATGQPYVFIQELKLTDIELPQVVEAAIAEKYRQEQLMLEYDYKLEREEKEADRKRTEAAGIRDYNLIAGEVSHDLLRWRSIEATTSLATSSNSKVVVLGAGGKGGMQMLLDVDGDDGPKAPEEAPEKPQDKAEAVKPETSQ